MAKGKKNGPNSGGDNNNNNNNSSSNNNNGGNNNSNNNGGNNNNNGGGGEKGGGGDYLNIVLKVDRHCEGCTQRIRKCLLSFSGVHTVSFEGETTVKIVAKKNIDAVKVTEHLKTKLSKMAELISPKPPKKDDQKKDNNNNNNNNKPADDKKPKEKELPIATVILKIQCHCTGCCEKTYKALSSHKGVYEVNIDKEKDLVTVKGKVDGKQMVESINKKLKKPVEIVPEKKNQKDKKDGGDGEKKQENNKDGGGGGGGGAKGGEKVPCDAEGYRFQYAYGYGYGPIVIDRATHFFSDENATGCSIM